ncbi:MAG: hypothetical protein KJ674_02200 [Nanoarchaeota archaeon]|nr:hypothetical protein [Nanoarchaeota archaeon]
MIIGNLVIFIISCLILILSGSFLVKSLSKISSFLKISEFAVGFLIMAVATSMPELFVGITAALNANSALALGTVIGSNIVDLTLVLGIIILLSREIKVKQKSIKKDALFMFFIAILPLVLMFLGNTLSRVDGVILIAVFLLYSHRLLKQSREFSKKVEDGVKRVEIVSYSGLFIISLLLLFFSANYVVKYATLLSIDLALPPILIGLFLIALGTSLPELVFGARAALTGHGGMSLGDIMGAIVVNSTLVLGVTAIIYPITADFLLFLVSGVFMILIIFLFVTFLESGNKLSWREGISLILFYVFFIVLELYIRTV